MKPRIFISLLLIFFGLNVKGQSDYYSTDSLSATGIKLIKDRDRINSQLCQVRNGNEIVEYTPYVVKEYGFNSNRVYISKDISIGDSTIRVFLERLHKGKITLFYYRGKNIKTFFIENDGSPLKEIPREDMAGRHFSELLNSYTEDCSSVSDVYKLVSYRKRSLSKFLSQYEHCESKPFPFLKYGLFVGMVQSKLAVNSQNSDEDFANASFNTGNNLYFGLFLDAPIHVSDFSFYTSLGLYQNSFASVYSSASHDVDILVNLTTIKVPLLIKYTFLPRQFRSYIDMGINYSYNLRNESIKYTADKNDDVIQFNTPSREDLVSDHQFGVALGLGIQHKIDYKRVLFIELRMNKEYSLKASDMFNKNNIEIIGGINL